MKLKFACNIGTMFESTLSLKDRLYRTTKIYGFDSIEVAFPYTWSIPEWKQCLTEHPVHVALINTPLGENREPGLAACCGKTKEFVAGISKAVEYCRALNCKQLHIMTGNEPEFVGQRELFMCNMREASTMLSQHGIQGCIETISSGVIPGYYLNTAQKSLDLLKELNLPNITFQFDVYHLNMLGHQDGEILKMFKEHKDYIKHVQVAQTPARNQLNAEGGVDYDVILRGFAEIGYSGHIGLEFKPTSFEEGYLTDFIKYLSSY